jgi:hypothetical protein
MPRDFDDDKRSRLQAVAECEPTAAETDVLDHRGVRGDVRRQRLVGDLHRDAARRPARQAADGTFDLAFPGPLEGRFAFQRGNGVQDRLGAAGNPHLGTPPGRRGS